MDYFEFETLVEDEGNDKYLILIIYDISDNKHRLEISKLLEGYGTRIQKSTFEAWLTKKHFEKLLSKLKDTDGFCSQMANSITRATPPMYTHFHTVFAIFPSHSFKSRQTAVMAKNPINTEILLYPLIISMPVINMIEPKPPIVASRIPQILRSASTVRRFVSVLSFFLLVKSHTSRNKNPTAPTMPMYAVQFSLTHGTYSLYA